MSKYLNDNEIQTYLITINNIYKKIYDFKNEIKIAEQHVNTIKEILKQKCSHNKIIDITSYDERSSYVCSICQQYL